MKRFTADNFTGCLVGGAIGDALGYFVEFLSSDEIFEKYGEDGLVDFSQEERDVHISDDTQMTLFTANGLLYYFYTGEADGRTPQQCIYQAYLDWLESQKETEESSPRVSWLLNVDAIRCRRAPGNTCLSALEKGQAGTVGEPVNNSKGCGGVMRVAPVGLYADNPGLAVHLAADAAAMTHGHPLGYIPAAAYAYIINRIIYTDDDLPEIITAMVEMLASVYGNHRETARLIELIARAVDLAAEGGLPDAYEGSDHHAENDPDPVVLAPPVKKYSSLDMKAESLRLEKLGGGWVAEETLAIALYCCLRFGDDFETAVKVAANHSGDSDSTASLTGAILGAAMGNSNMPTKYVMLLEMYDIISEVAKDLFEGCPASGNSTVPDTDELREKYGELSYV